MTTLAEQPGEGRIAAPGTPRDVARDPGSVAAPWLAGWVVQVAGEQIAGR